MLGGHGHFSREQHLSPEAWLLELPRPASAEEIAALVSGPRRCDAWCLMPDAARCPPPPTSWTADALEHRRGKSRLMGGPNCRGSVD